MSIEQDMEKIADAVTGAERSAVARQVAKGSTGHAKFQKLATIRTRTAMRAMRLIAKMGRSKVFEYSTEEAQKIVATLSAELVAVEKALAEPQHQTDIEFDL